MRTLHGVDIEQFKTFPKIELNKMINELEKEKLKEPVPDIDYDIIIKVIQDYVDTLPSSHEATVTPPVFKKPKKKRLTSDQRAAAEAEQWLAMQV